MSYTFDIIGVTPVLTFLDYQHSVEHHRQRSKAYLGSHRCSLDAFIRSTEMIPQKPEWDWDEVAAAMVSFWLRHEESIQRWKNELEGVGRDNLLVARVANLALLRTEFELLLKE
jgi:hypothetical protein